MAAGERTAHAANGSYAPAPSQAVLAAERHPVSAQRLLLGGAVAGGATAGVATGKAFVGTLGTARILRHSVVGNLVPKAAALERLASRYPDCGVMVGGDMIPAIEGYFQYLLVDAIALPGSNGKRRRIASVKGPMCGVRPGGPQTRGRQTLYALTPNTASKPVPAEFPPSLLSVALAISNPLPAYCPYAEANAVMDGALRAFKRIDDDEAPAAAPPRRRSRNNTSARRSTALDPTALAALAAAVRPFQQRVRDSEAFAAKRRPVPHERADQRVLSGPSWWGVSMCWRSWRG